MSERAILHIVCNGFTMRILEKAASIEHAGIAKVFVYRTDGTRHVIILQPVKGPNPVFQCNAWKEMVLRRIHQDFEGAKKMRLHDAKKFAESVSVRHELQSAYNLSDREVDELMPREGECSSEERMLSSSKSEEI